VHVFSKQKNVFLAEISCPVRLYCSAERAASFRHHDFAKEAIENVITVFPTPQESKSVVPLFHFFIWRVNSRRGPISILVANAMAGNPPQDAIMEIDELIRPF